MSRGGDRSTRRHPQSSTAAGDEVLSALRTDRDASSGFRATSGALLAAFQAAQAVVEFRSNATTRPASGYSSANSPAQVAARYPEAIGQPLIVDLEEEFFPVQFINAIGSTVFSPNGWAAETTPNRSSRPSTSR